jgi:hypothetical protein
MVMAAVSQAISAVVNEQPYASCPGIIRRRNSNINSNTNVNANTFDPMGRQADLDDIDIIEDDPDFSK